jgi:ABC-2 type transport system permease protein
MNIFLRELKANRRALIIWGACMFLLVFAGMAKYTAYSSGNGQTMTQLIATMPSSIKALMGFGSFDVSKMSGYFALLNIYAALGLAFHAALLGAGIIAKEERDKTAEYLMVKPVSRASVITSKLIAALFNIVVLNIVTLVSYLVFIPIYSKDQSITGEILVMMLSVFIMQLIFLSLGTVLAACMKNPKGAGGIATGIILISYFVSRLTDMFSKLNILNLLSPFKYFDLVKIVNENGRNGLSIIAVILSLALAAVFTYLTYFFYKRRDLKV